MQNILISVTILLVAASANATITANFTNNGTEHVEGMVFNPITYMMEELDVYLVHNVMTVDTDGEFMLAGLEINLTQGSIVNINDYIDSEPPAGAVPIMFYDTYFATPEDITNAAFMQKSITPTALTVDWYVPNEGFVDGNMVNLPSYVPGAGVDQLIASISFSPDAMGTITGYFADFDLAYAGTPQAIDTDRAIVNGAIIPEPVTMSLLAIGGIGVLLRKKR